MIEVHNINKSFDKKHILKDINVTFEKGKIVGLIGPSGTGKTTLIQCILGMEKTDTGWVTVNDREIPNRKVLKDIGYMAQSDALYEDLTGKENLKFFAGIYIKKRKYIKERIKSCSEMVQLQDALNQKVSTYSGGMKRRLSLAISFLQDPNILILDEPTVGIDPKLRQAVWQDLEDAKQRNKSILVTTHVLDEASRCDKLLLMNHGKIIASGSPDELKQQYNAKTIEEVFLKMED
ncbi:ABC transporter ATP-binding protein [Staphylococcus succinus]|jgi:ABC-2 type transport system ATP-binding protein|uniref:Glycosyl transferase family 2 n=1 Tax=Staphylococcus succinus TaxID=61015 RepID=A0A9Q6MUE1_9STAP|nr:ABC transporter ATP-binding protein [Staphylococcus succinus]MEB8127383.1 ABC transporter ATP-binding protein [Staphylococcus succinus]MEB8210223.1 ABC transporter ATP-binding protein [Staphylococcus succinus]PTI43614.1 glycosyl transferase family 2 [Staphylococcus succinus]PTI75214.1 glycosyl transferase family 2 [Staphylococcus succinus]PTJ20281.1 glycosyl transferase family 2 [Staphylococcus succinus]